MSDWDAAKYHRISDPQLAWGRIVAERLAAAPGERILDVGCGTGRLTQEIAGKPGITVVGLDRSAAMLRQAATRGQTPSTLGLTPTTTRGQTPRGGGGQQEARGTTDSRWSVPTTTASGAASIERCQTLDSNSYTPSDDRGQTPGGVPTYVLGDGANLPFVSAFDAIFSAATFHWIADHDRLFRSVYTALKPGGRLVAQCGGARNLDRLYGRARVLMQSTEYARHFSGWRDFNHFENVTETKDRLLRAGFADIDVSLVESPVTFESPEQFTEFVAAVCLRHHLDRLPAGDRDAFMRRMTDQAVDDDPPLTLDYWRLNIAARKAAA